MRALRGVALSMFVVVLVAVHPSYGQNSAEDPWAKGVALGSEAKFPEAKDAFVTALKLAPFYYAAESCVRVINDVISKKLEPDAAIHLFKGAAFGHKKQKDMEIAEYNKAIAINRRFVQAYSDRGTFYYANGQYDLARADFGKAIDIDPRFAGAYYNRGILSYRQGRYDDAILDFNKAIELNPIDPICHTMGVASSIAKVKNNIGQFGGSGLEISFFVCYLLNHFANCSIVNPQVICNLFQCIPISHMGIINPLIPALFPS